MSLGEKTPEVVAYNSLFHGSVPVGVERFG